MNTNLDSAIIDNFKRLDIDLIIPNDWITINIKGNEIELSQALSIIYSSLDSVNHKYYADLYDEGWPSKVLQMAAPETVLEYQACDKHPYFAIFTDVHYSMYLLRADDTSDNPIVYFLDHDDFSEENATEHGTLSEFLASLKTREEANQIIQNKDLDFNVKEIEIATKLGDRYPEEIVRLEIFNSNIEDISGLEEFESLRDLFAQNNNIVDIAPLGNLNRLENLDLSRNNIVDISALSGLSNLKTLKLRGNKNTDISVIYGLKNLEELEIEENNIDFDKLNELPNLKVLNGRR